MHSLAYGLSLLSENAIQEKKILSLVNRQNIVLLNSINMVATKKLSRQNATYLF